MHVNFGSARRVLTATMLAATIGAAAWATPAAAGNLFSSFTGDWTGSGQIVLSDGSQESIRCKASYTTSPSGDRLNIKVNCASDSTRVNIISNVVAQGSSFSGTWRETTRQAQGDVTGSVPVPGQYQATLSGTGFNIELSATAKGNQQAVVIKSQGTDVQSVRISLRRA